MWIFFRKKNKEKELQLAVFFLFLLAILTRIPYLDGSFWLDEAAQALESIRPFSQQLQIATDFQPPLFHIIVHFFTYFSQSEWWLRLPSVMAGLVSILFTFLIGRKYYQTSIAFLATLLLATSSFHIFYSQELRPYALSAAFAAVGWWCLLNYLHPTQSWLQRIIRWKMPFERAEYFYAFSLVSIAGLYSTYLYPFCLIGQLIYWVLQTKKSDIRNISIFLAVLFFGFLPWTPSFIGQFKTSSTLRASTPEWEYVVSTPQLKAVPLVLGKFLFGVIDIDLNIPFILLTLAVVLPVGIVFLLTQKESKHSYLILASWLLVPIITAWLVSFFVPVLQAKRVLFVLPAWYLFLSVLYVRGFQHPRQWVKTISTLSFIALVYIQIWSMTSYYFNPRYQREDWHSLIQRIDGQFSAKDTAIIFAFDHPFSPWDWYEHQSFPVLLTGTATKTDIKQLNQPLLSATQFDTILVFDYLRDLTDPLYLIDRWLVQNNYTQIEVIDTPNIGFVRVYIKGESVANYKPTSHY